MSQKPTSDTREHDDLGVTHTDADTISYTRFGPRPVPKGHRRPAGPHESRRIPPHGDVSPDGSRVWPRPSLMTRWLVWGGTAIAAAALTAGTVLAARHVGDMLESKQKPLPPAKPQPKRASTAFQPQPRPASAPRRPRAPRPGLMEEVNTNTAHLTGSLDQVMKSVTAAFAGFRTVAGQASTIMREFQTAADLARGVFNPAGPRESPKHTDTPMRAVRNTTDAGPVRGSTRGPEDGDPRTHRL